MIKSLAFFFAVFLSATVLANEKSVYSFSWLDKDKEIYVLQNRRFRKDGQVYVGVTGSKTLSGAFIDAYGGTARGGFFWSEDWGFELVYGKSSGSENDTAKGVFEQANSVAYYRKVDSFMGGMLMWSPFYSKINTFNKVFYFDWMFGVGLASVKTLDNRNRFEVGSTNEKELTSENNMGGIWNTGLRFYINDNWSLRADITGLHFNAKKARNDGSQDLKTNKLFNNYDLGLGLNYAF